MAVSKAQSMLSAIAKLASGNVMAQAIPFLALPFLSRVYSPADFGHFAFFVAITTFISILILLRLDVAIISETKVVVRRRLLATGQMVAISGAVFIAFVVALVQLICGVEDNYWYVLSIGGFALALHNLNIGWLNADKQYSSISYFLTLRSTLWVAVASVWSFLFPQHENGLIFAFVASFVLTSLIQTVSIVQKFGFYGLNASKLRLVLTRFKSFPQFNLPHALMSNINASAPAYILQFYNHTTVLGYFSQTNRLIMTPWHMVSNALYRVLYKDTATQLDSYGGGIKQLQKIWGLYAMLTTVLFLALYFFISDLIVFILGSSWVGAAKVAIVMLPWFFFRTISGVLAFVPILAGQQKRALQVEVFYTLCVVLALVIGIRNGDGVIALSWFSWTASVIVAAQLFWYWKLAFSLSFKKIKQT